MDNRIVRCWIHPSLKEEFIEWQKKLNQVAVRETNYPIQRLESVPLTSNLCAMILKKVRTSLKKEDFNIFFDKKTKKLNIEIVFELLGNKKGDKNNLNLELHKLGGIKKNELFFK